MPREPVRRGVTCVLPGRERVCRDRGKSKWAGGGRVGTLSSAGRSQQPRRTARLSGRAQRAAAASPPLDDPRP